MINEIQKREIDYSWDFKTANTKELTHCYHNYPAMMIPQVARRLLKEYTPNNGKTLFDPYCGTGTSLLEANLLGLKNIGTDLNPLARIIAKAKNELYNIELVSNHIQLFDDLIFQSSFNKDILKNGIERPSFKNIDYWFSENVIKKLGFLKNYIQTKIPHLIKNFFIVAFSETVREGSFTRNSEFKLFRIKKSQIPQFNPDIYQIFLSKLKRNFNGLKTLHKNICKTDTNIYDFNTCNEIPENLFLNEKVDIVVTSPPYGDSKTTVAYGQFSRLANQWLDIENASKIDNELMGGKKQNISNSFQIESASWELEQIRAADSKRYNEVLSFLFDYDKSIQHIAKIVRKDGVVCYVVGNRSVKNTQIPLDLITAEFFIKNGFKHLKTIVRNIPNKRMPKMNSPSNVTGIKKATINNEYIVILKKF